MLAFGGISALSAGTHRGRTAYDIRGELGSAAALQHWVTGTLPALRPGPSVQGFPQPASELRGLRSRLFVRRFGRRPCLFRDVLRLRPECRAGGLDRALLPAAILGSSPDVTARPVPHLHPAASATQGLAGGEPVFLQGGAGQGGPAGRTRAARLISSNHQVWRPIARARSSKSRLSPFSSLSLARSRTRMGKAIAFWCDCETFGGLPSDRTWRSASWSASRSSA